MKKLVVFALVAGALAACSKDKFQTVPQVEINEFGPEEVTKGQLIKLIATATDKEADMQDSVYVVRKRYNNGIVLGSPDTSRYYVAALGAPKKDKVEIQVQFLYGEVAPEIAPIQNLESNFDRKFTIGLIVRDKAGNRSQYVESDTIILKKFP